MRKEFQTHKLTAEGLSKINEIGVHFDDLLEEIEILVGEEGREIAIVRSNLEVACFYAKKALANDPQYLVTIVD